MSTNTIAEDVVMDEDDLAGLPTGSVVLSHTYRHHEDDMAVAFQRWPDGAWHRGARSGSTHPDNFLPATVIHRAAQ